MNQSVINLLALSLVPGLGTVRAHKLLKWHGSAGEILGLPRRELKQLGFSAEGQVYIASGRALSEAEAEVATLNKMGVQLVTLADPIYPSRLKEIYDPPLVLYSIGNASTLESPAVAIVGSRKASVYGQQMAIALSRDLASLGLTIVSGMARGIDSKAHKGALLAGGRTVAVLGTGVDVVYPLENRSLYSRIAENGCIVSEFPIGTFPAPQNFPIRNRIISGLSLGTLIPEASEFSGSLITARLTLEQNRELWAVPGNVTNPGSYGPNYLIKQGARPIMCAQDVLDELPLPVLYTLQNCEEESPKGVESQRPSGSESKLVGLMPVDDSIHFDELLDKASLSMSALNEALFKLELEGRVKQLPGRFFVRLL